jgi:ElaB/YqjD/DUF883 family membrane-anchored ribosome-binding protein
MDDKQLTQNRCAQQNDVSECIERQELTMEETLINSIRHDTLQAIEKAEKLLRETAIKDCKGGETLRNATDHLVEHLKKELERWERKYKKVKMESNAFRAHTRDH